jgi:hypothetical protein
MDYWVVQVFHHTDNGVLSKQTAETELRLHQFRGGDLFGIAYLAKQAYQILKAYEAEEKQNNA